jgi:pimeloyl-ACP methyl ester carboxylesterase
MKGDQGMPYMNREGTALFYEDIGAGPAIITTHGVTENSHYWILPGIVDALVRAGFRVISTDMRGHGRSRVTKGPPGFDVDTIAEDFGAIADHLDIDRFHLLTHATGGIAGLRYAMRHHRRLLSLMSTDTGSATLPTDAAAAVTDPDTKFERVPLSENVIAQGMAASMRGHNWDDIVAESRATARENVFLNSMHEAKNPEAAFGMLEAIQRRGDPDTLAEFMSSFYDDPDPQIAGLREISCPCLILLGEHDQLFIKPSELLAREIPDNHHVVWPGRGHMTALEDPERTARELIAFLADVGRVLTS